MTSASLVASSADAAPQLSHAEALAILESRLGREPQDVLEAAVVLEAWGGLPAEAALAAAEDIFESLHPAAAPADDTRESDKDTPRAPSDALTMLLAIASILLWTGPIRSQLGASAFADAVRLSVPLTLGVQWFLAARYLFDRWWLERLNRDGRLLALIAVGGIVAGAAAGHVALLSVELCLLWACAGLVLRRGHHLSVIAVFGSSTYALFAGAPVLLVLAALDGALLVLLGVILRGAGNGMYRGRPWRIALRASLIGVALGTLLFSDARANFGEDPRSLALALLPSMLASFWGGWHLASMWAAIGDDLRGRALAESAEASWRSSACRVAAGAAGRIALAVGLLTPACAAAGSAAGWRVAGATSLCGLAAFAFATVGASLLNAIERSWLGLVAVVGGCSVTLVVDAFGNRSGGTGLLAGSVAAVVVMLPAAIQLRRPARLLASIVR
jgi:hypothetical protein